MVYTVRPNNVECFYIEFVKLLHSLILKALTAQCMNIFQSACLALGLSEDDKQSDDTLQDAALTNHRSHTDLLVVFNF
jgi:hypothetical protein